MRAARSGITTSFRACNDRYRPRGCHLLLGGWRRGLGSRLCVGMAAGGSALVGVYVELRDNEWQARGGGEVAAVSSPAWRTGEVGRGGGLKKNEIEGRQALSQSASTPPRAALAAPALPRCWAGLICRKSRSGIHRFARRTPAQRPMRQCCGVWSSLPWPDATPPGRGGGGRRQAYLLESSEFCQSHWPRLTLDGCTACTDEQVPIAHARDCPSGLPCSALVC